MSLVHQEFVTLSSPGIRIEEWREAEAAAQKIMKEFRPTIMAENYRKGIINYMEEFIRRNLGLSVLAYGSTPLKTYLPEGDIDLTVCGAINSDQAKEIAFLLESKMIKSKAKNRSGKFAIRDVKFIDAEVKLIKCIVGNIPVDISFNQIGGLSTLCFLEHVDRKIGRNHLYKESLILVKAWCYYESRTLGSHVSLLSTYGLEILVLYIINVFYRSLTGPLSVLHTFLLYFSTFDWGAYCISLLGIVRRSDMMLLPYTHDLLIDGYCLRSCWDMFCVSKASEHGFQSKNMNIIDPFKLENNLGKSISPASFYRLRSAFRYGAENRSRILMAGQANKELHGFFGNAIMLQSIGEGRPEFGGGSQPLDGNWFEIITSLDYACREVDDIPLLLPYVVARTRMSLGIFHNFMIFTSK